MTQSSDNKRPMRRLAQSKTPSFASRSGLLGHLTDVRRYKLITLLFGDGAKKHTSDLITTSKMLCVHAATTSWMNTNVASSLDQKISMVKILLRALSNSQINASFYSPPAASRAPLSGKLLSTHFYRLQQYLHDSEVTSPKTGIPHVKDFQDCVTTSDSGYEELINE